MQFHLQQCAHNLCQKFVHLKMQQKNCTNDYVLVTMVAKTQKT
jgi:hypothetical protein